LKKNVFFLFVLLAGFDFNVAFFLGLAFAWAFHLLVALALAWLLLVDLAHLRHFPEQVVSRFGLQSLPASLLRLFLLAQLLLHPLRLV
jgi:hypothetical protein